MRKIKFRGKDAFTGKWVYGDLVHNQKVTENGLEPRVMVGGYEVNPETVGQFTGLHDCDGNEIYEGDIVEHTYYQSAREVLWDGERAGFDGWFTCEQDRYRLLGNVFENPRPQEGGKQ